VVDVGAASGAVGLMAAARESGARFVFVERDPDLAELCRCNCRRNGVEAQIAAVDILDRPARLGAGLERESADWVLTNPPFLEEGQARLSPDPGRAAAHALPANGLASWLRACTGLLKPKGRLVLIHRADRVAECLDLLGRSLGGIALRFVHPSADRPAIRVLLSGAKGSRAPLAVLPPVVLNGPDGRFTPQAEALHRGDAVLT
jgi:tRNA1(Val) A37 N6-methylase TrmN6